MNANHFETYQAMKDALTSYKCRADLAQSVARLTKALAHGLV